MRPKAQGRFRWSGLGEGRSRESLSGRTLDFARCLTCSSSPLPHDDMLAQVDDRRLVLCTVGPRRLAGQAASAVGEVRGAVTDRSGAFVAGGRVRLLTQGTQVIGSTGTARPYDERHSAALDVSYRTPRGWTWALAWTAHSGWPHSPAIAVLDSVPGVSEPFVRRAAPSPVFSERLGGYRRLDVQVSRTFKLGHGQAGFFAEIFNLLGATNQRGWDYQVRLTKGTPETDRFRTEFLPRLPSVGMRWEF